MLLKSLFSQIFPFVNIQRCLYRETKELNNSSQVRSYGILRIVSLQLECVSKLFTAEKSYYLSGLLLYESVLAS